MANIFLPLVYSTLQERCIISSDTADCTWSAGGADAPATGITTTSMTAITSADFFIPVTVTGGFKALETNQLELRQALDQCLTGGITGVTQTTFPTATGKPTSTGSSTRSGTATGATPTGTAGGTNAAGGVERPAAVAVAALAGVGALAMAL